MSEKPEQKAPYYERYNYIGQKGGLTKVRVFTGTDRIGHANYDHVCDCIDDQTARLTVERLNDAVALKSENARLREALERIANDNYDNTWMRLAAREALKGGA
mgnify:CR=1 FL=1